MAIARRIRVLLARQRSFHFLEGIEVLLQAADVLLHFQDRRAELGDSTQRTARLSGLLENTTETLGVGAPLAHRAANIPQGERPKKHSDHHRTTERLFCHLGLLSRK